jgi:hypothetical protein
MRAAGAVVHRRARIGQEGTVQRVLHPVAALHPCAVVPVARGLQARTHRQQIFNRDLLLARIDFRVAQRGKVVGNRLPHALDLSALDGDPDERGDYALRRRFDVREARGARAVVVALDEELSPPAHEQTVGARKLRGGGNRAGKNRRPLRRRGGLRLDDRRQRQPEREHQTQPAHVPI